MKRLIFILAALLVLTPLAIWWASPEQVIKRRTKHLMEVISIDSGTGSTFRQAKVFSMNALLAPEVELVSPDIPDANGSFDKEVLESAFSWICQNAKQSEMTVENFESIVITGDRAAVRATVKGFLELAVYRPADGRFDVTIEWIKGGDGWRFEKVIWKNL